MRRRNRSRTRQLVTLGAVSATLAVPAATRADPPTFGAGGFVSYTVGARNGLEWGLEAFSTYRFAADKCRASMRRSGVGGLAQVAWLDSTPRITLAAHGGGEFQRSLLAFAGELGLTYRFATQERFGLHLGLVPEVSFFNLAFRYQALLDELSWGVGTRVMPTFGMPGEADCGFSNSIVGRPLRGESGIEPEGAALHEDDATGATDDAVRDVGLAWEHDAQLECASIPAFMQLACELAWHGAPSALVQRALEAIRDEAFHAEACARLASAHLGERVTPALPDVTPRRILPSRAGLVRLAVESWIDGCLGEGRASRNAAEAACRAAPGEARTLQSRIAEDEARHAELAWDVLLWTVLVGGDEVREALRAVRGLDLRLVSGAPEGLERFARLGAGEELRVAEAHADDARARLDRILS